MTNADKIALVAAVIGGLGFLVALTGVIVARAANAINNQSGRRQIAVAERELYLGLVAERTAWMVDFREAFIQRQKEWREQAEALTNKQHLGILLWDRRLDSLAERAAWLFDHSVTDCVNEIDKHQGRALQDYWDWLKQGNEALGQYDVGPDARAMELAHNAFGRLFDQMDRYLYVGDIQRKAGE